VAQREVERQAVQVLNEALRYSQATINILEDVVRSLSRVPGRKLCLIVSDGFLDGSGSRESRAVDLRRVLDAALRSGTAVYALGLLRGGREQAGGAVHAGGGGGALGGAAHPGGGSTRHPERSPRRRRDPGGDARRLRRPAARGIAGPRPRPRGPLEDAVAGAG